MANLALAKIENLKSNESIFPVGLADDMHCHIVTNEVAVTKGTTEGSETISNVTEAADKAQQANTGLKLFHLVKPCFTRERSYHKVQWRIL